jgi:hypothetical protein
MATLALRGRAEGSALLEIAGQVNPSARPLALDIRAKATDLELAPLSPYAGKYAGYAIERGKLSVDVAYKIEPDGHLTARNKIVLNQLTFGDKVQSASATTLPVRLAVALLKDREGIINLDLPVSGSLADPQFSLFGLMWRVLGNVMVKAVASPFSLLSGGGGGGDAPQAQQLLFAPGTAALAQDQPAALERVAQVLTERPVLNLTITGVSQPGTETEAYRAAGLEQQLLAERRRELLRGGAAPDVTVTLTAEDRARLLQQLYDRADLPDKPRRLLGVVKKLPADDMARLLSAAQPAGPDAMRQLALQRGLAVRDALIAKGVDSDRLFLATPAVAGAQDAGPPRAQLALTVD